MVIVSYICSDYKDLSYMGSPTDGEGVLVLLSYMILFLSGINYFYNEKSIKYLEKSIIILISIIILLGSIEFFYKPIFEISFFQKLLASKEYYAVINSIKNNDYKDMVSLTLYNPNYFGGLLILLFPIIMNLFIMGIVSFFVQITVAIIFSVLLSILFSALNQSMLKLFVPI